MANLDAKTELINEIVNWAYTQENVRALLLVESASENNLDPFFYDIVIVAVDSDLFSRSDWLLQSTNHFVQLESIVTGNPYAESSMTATFEDGTRLRYQIWQKRSITKHHLPPELEDGFIALLDKDDLVDKLLPNVQKRHIPTVPNKREYYVLIEEFFYQATNVARCLWREELLPAKHYFHRLIIHDALYKMLEWFIEINNNWSVELNSSGIGFKKLLGAELWSEYKLLYVGSNLEENWNALSESINIFRKVAIEVGKYVGFSYPYDLDKRVIDYLNDIKQE